MDIEKSFNTVNNILKKNLDDKFKKEFLRLKQITKCENIKEKFIKELVYKVNTEFNLSIKEMIDTDASFISAIKHVFYFHLYHTEHLDIEREAKIQKDENYKSKLIYVVLHEMQHKYYGDIILFGNMSEYSPEVIWINQLCTEQLILLQEMLKHMDKDHLHSYVFVLFQKVFMTIKSISSLIAKKYYSDAIMLWRNLFESECLLSLMFNKEILCVEYFKNHSEYKKILLENDNDELAKSLDAEMKKYNLKDKDKYAFINYGWLLKNDEFYKGYKNRVYKLSFKSGLAKFAGNECLYDKYSFASNFVHASDSSLRYKSDDLYVFIMAQTIASLSQFCIFFKSVSASISNDSFKEKLNVHNNNSKNIILILEDLIKVFNQKYGDNMDFAHWLEQYNSN